MSEKYRLPSLKDYLVAVYVDDDPRYIVLEECDTFSTYTVVDTSDNERIEYCGTDWRGADRSASDMNIAIQAQARARRSVTNALY